MIHLVAPSFYATKLLYRERITDTGERRGDHITEVEHPVIARCQPCCRDCDDGAVVSEVLIPERQPGVSRAAGIVMMELWSPKF